jgi:hypothetical protein
MQHRPQGRPTGKAKEMGDESMLRTRAREAMKSGKLPGHEPEHTWGGPGSGAPCAVCGESVGAGEVEFELQFASAGSSGAASCHMHSRCFAAWQLERRNGRLNGQVLPSRADDGIIPGRERNVTGQGEPG